MLLFLLYVTQAAFTVVSLHLLGEVWVHPSFSGSEPCADDVIESRSGFRMLTHHAGPLMSSVTPFVCGPPLYLWQALHFLLQAGRVFVAWWFQGFRPLCPFSAPPFGNPEGGGSCRQADGEETNWSGRLGERNGAELRGISSVEVTGSLNQILDQLVSGLIQHYLRLLW